MTEPTGQRALVKQLIFEPMRLRLLLLSLGMGLAAAAIMPVLSTHLAINLGIEPIWIGVMFATNTLSGVVVSQWLAKHSDDGLSRVKIIRVCLVIAFFSALALGWAQQYVALLVAGLFLFGAVSPVQPQLFALAREQVTDGQAALYQSLLRATFSLSWIIGPPLAYILFETIGFMGLSVICAFMFFMAGLNVKHLKDTPFEGRATEIAANDSRMKWLMLAIGAVFAANSMYIVYMPIYVRETLQLASVVPGFLMGTAAGLEIPLMLFAGAFANRWRLFSPLKIASFCGLGFYLGVILFDSITGLILIQVLNAAFIGVIAGIGITVVQSLMEGRMGMASTLYTNGIKIGSLVGALLGGVIAQWFGIKGVFIACAVAALISIIALYIASPRRKTPSYHPH